MDSRPSARAPERAPHPAFRCGAALGAASAFLLSAGAGCRTGKAPSFAPSAIGEVLERTETLEVRLPPPLGAEEVVFVRRRGDGGLIAAGPEAVALVRGDSARVLARRPGERPSGTPAVREDGSVLVPFSGRIDAYDASGAFVESRARAGPLHALAAHDGRIAAAGVGDGGRLLHLSDPPRDLFPLDVRRDVAMRFRARLDTDIAGTLWAIHPARYAVYGLTRNSEEIRIEGACPGYVPPRPYRGPPSPRAIRAWIDGAWVVETVVAARDGPVLSIRACGRPLIEIHGPGTPRVVATPGLRLVGRDEDHRLLFVPADAEGPRLTLEVYEMRDTALRPARTRRRAPALFVFVSSHDCPACLPVLADVEELLREHGPHGLHVRAIVDAADRDGFRIVALEAPELVALADRRGEARRRLAVEVGPALRLVSADGDILLTLDGAPPLAAAAALRKAVETHCACRAGAAP